MDVKTFLQFRESVSPRYLGCAFSSNEISQLKKLHVELLKFLSPIEDWTQPGEFDSPAVPISRRIFCDLVFSKRHQNGLLIQFPEEWMFDWTELDKGVFWTTLSQTYGVNKIYVIFKGTPSNIQEVSKYFNQVSIDNSNTSVWTSKYE